MPTSSGFSIVLNGLLAGELSVSGNICVMDLLDVSNIDLAGESFVFTGNTKFSVSDEYEELRLLSIANFTIPANTSILAKFSSGSGDLEMASVQGEDFEGTTLCNPDGNLTLQTAVGDILINNSSIRATDGRFLSIDAAIVGSGNLSINNSDVFSSCSFGNLEASADNISITGNSDLMGGDNVTLTAGTVGLTVDSSTITANSDGGNVNIYSAVNATITNSIIAASTDSSNSPVLSVYAAHVVTVVNSTLTGNYVNVNAGQTITMNNVDMNSSTGINMSARTINLSNINFPSGSQVSLSSQNGVLAPNPNTSANSVTGDVNFITNVKYNNLPAQNFVPTSVGGSSSSPTAPIQISSGSFGVSTRR